jgi:hypothetical protein
MRTKYEGLPRRRRRVKGFAIKKKARPNRPGHVVLIELPGRE